MNFYFRFLFLLIFSFSFSLASQDISPEILSKLSSEQVEALIGNKSAPVQISQPKPVVTDSLQNTSNLEDINKIDGEKYGYKYFSTIPTSISAVGDLPLPNEYKISLKDQFTIILSGSRDAIFDLSVELDGTILFPELGPISVIGETLEQVRNKLKNLVNQSYIGVNIDLSIKNLAAKKVTIVGAVKNPGSYLVNPFSTISSALAYSGGISEIGTLRAIKLIRTSGEEFEFDLYKLLINGDRSQDVTIEAGDVILVDPAKHFIHLKGEVKRPAIYEILDNETLEDLINFGLGLKMIANKSNINLSVLDIQSSSVIDMQATGLESNLKNVLEVNVYPYINKTNSGVFVSGAIKEPGFYSLNEFRTLEELINNLEFIDVYPWLAVLEQFDDDNLIKSSTLFSLKDKSTYESVDLLEGSRVFFTSLEERTFPVSPQSSNLISDYRLQLQLKGEKFSLPVTGTFQVNSLLSFLGLDLSDISFDATYISPLDNLVITDDYRNMEFDAKKYHTIIFKAPINDLISVSISGQVEYPGTYTLESDATIEDLYKLATLKDDAYTSGIIFTRESVRQRQLDAIADSRKLINEAILINIQKGNDVGDVSLIKNLSESFIEPDNLGRIAGDYSPNNKSATKTILFSGDSLIIPKNPNVINVLGSVLNPIAFEYDEKLSVRDAISLAGGFQDYADESKIYVIKSGDLGSVKHVDASYFQSWLTSGYWGNWKDNPLFLWRLSKKHGSNGVLGDLGVHLFDFVTFPVGEIKKIFCYLKTHKEKGERIGDYFLDANDSFLSIVRFKNGATGTISSSRMATGYRNRLKLKIFCEKGAVRIEFDDPVAEGDSFDITKNIESEKMRWEKKTVHQTLNNFERFIFSINSGINDQPNFKRGAQIQKILDGCFKSSKKKIWVKI